MTPMRKRAAMRSRFAAPPPARPEARPASGWRADLLLPPSTRTAAQIFWLLAAINLINYLDRFIFVAVAPILRTTLHLSQGEIGQATSAFLLIYTLTALPMGFLADRGMRPKIIACGVILWSLATWYTAIAHTFAQLFISRALLGIGEATYVPAGLALLGAYFAAGDRARILSRWGAGTLVGTALGFVLGGVIAHHLGWRWAFVICGPPGLVLGALMWRMPDRAGYDQHDAPANTSRQSFALADLRARTQTILRSVVVRRAIVIQALGFFFTTPAIIFVPIYLHEHFRINEQSTALLAGAVLIPGGVLGTLLGGSLADRLSRNYAGGRMMTVAISFFGAAPLFVLALLSRQLWVMLVLTFVATAFINMFNGPLNAIVQDVIPAQLRASAMAIILTLAHLAGDVFSPTLIGSAADHMHRWGTAGALVFLGCPALAIGAVVAALGVRSYVAELHQDPDDLTPLSAPDIPVAPRPAVVTGP